MAKNCNFRNYGCGRNLTHFKTRENLANRVRQAEGRGTAIRDKTISALGNLAGYLKENHGHRTLEKCTPEQMAGWAQHLRKSGLSASTTSSYVSAANRVVELVGRKDLRLSAWKEGLARGLKYSNEDRSISPVERDAFKEWLSGKASLTGDIRYEALSHSIDLQASGGLRRRESIRTSPQDNRPEDGRLFLGRADGTKNARPRESQILDPAAFERAAAFQARHPEFDGSLIPANMSMKQYIGWLKDVQRAYEAETGRKAPGYHGNRHWYAQERYAQEMSERIGVRIECPVRVGLHGEDHIAHIAKRAGISFEEARALDEAVRLEVSADLGHGRLEIVRAYLGD